MHTLFRLGVASTCLPAILNHAEASNRKNPPNILFFLVDDMGWQDTSLPFYTSRTFLNNRYRTPNMERLAKEGVVFTQAYAHPICSPTRISLLTGMNPARHRVTMWTLFRDKSTDGQMSTLTPPPDWNMNGVQPVGTLPSYTTTRPITEETYSGSMQKPYLTANTLPELLRQNGYYTIHCGKAHFSTVSTAGENPIAFGFDVNIAGGANGAPGSYLASRNFGEGTQWAVQGLEKYYGQDLFLTEALTREALSALDKPIADKKPFYLYLSHYAVHSPYDEDKRFSANYRHRYDEQLKDTLNEWEVRYAALVEGMDKSLGDVLDYLAARPEVAENTILLFMSDNGGQGLNNIRQGKENRDQNYPARAGKGSAFMGGVREPMMVYWPYVTQGGTQNSNPVMIEDFFPSILEMAGINEYRTTQTVDGVSFVPLLRHPEMRRERPIVWHFPNLWGETQDEEEGYGAFSALLHGDYHLIYHWKSRRLRLYNIRTDIGEQHDLASTHPDIVRRLSAELTAELRRMDAQRPVWRSTGRPIAYPDGTE